MQQRLVLRCRPIWRRYVHSDAKFAAVIAVRLGCYGFAVAGIVATLHIAFGG